jgi:hypothetical protein
VSHQISHDRIPSHTVAALTPEHWDSLLDADGIIDAHVSSGWIGSEALLEDDARSWHLPFQKGPGRGGILLALLVRPVPGAKGFLAAPTPYGYGELLTYGVAPRSSARRTRAERMDLSAGHRRQLPAIQPRWFAARLWSRR